MILAKVETALTATQCRSGDSDLEGDVIETTRIQAQTVRAFMQLSSIANDAKIEMRWQKSENGADWQDHGHARKVFDDDDGEYRMYETPVVAPYMRMLFDKEGKSSFRFCVYLLGDSSIGVDEGVERVTFPATVTEGLVGLAP